MPKNGLLRVRNRTSAIGFLLAVFAAAPFLLAQNPVRELHILAASDLQPVMPAIADAYEHATGIHLVASFASSSTLATQITNGAPGDVFLSANYTFAETVLAANLADDPRPVPYARGTLVLFALKSSPFQPLTQNTLRDPRIQSLAVADPLHAPYGLAAQQALTAMHLYDELKPHLVTAENIAQTAQFVESGNAQLGLTSLTLADSPHMREIGTYIRMPALYAPLRQCAVVLKSSPDRAAAHAFLDWLTSKDVQQNLPKYGLDPAQ